MRPSTVLPGLIHARSGVRAERRADEQRPDVVGDDADDDQTQRVGARRVAEPSSTSAGSARRTSRGGRSTRRPSVVTAMFGIGPTSTPSRPMKPSAPAMKANAMTSGSPAADPVRGQRSGDAGRDAGGDRRAVPLLGDLAEVLERRRGRGRRRRQRDHPDRAPQRGDDEDRGQHRRRRRSAAGRFAVADAGPAAASPAGPAGRPRRVWAAAAPASATGGRRGTPRRIGADRDAARLARRRRR